MLQSRGISRAFRSNLLPDNTSDGYCRRPSGTARSIANTSYRGRWSAVVNQNLIIHTPPRRRNFLAGYNFCNFPRIAISEPDNGLQPARVVWPGWTFGPLHPSNVSQELKFIRENLQREIFHDYLFTLKSMYILSPNFVFSNSQVKIIIFHQLKVHLLIFRNYLYIFVKQFLLELYRYVRVGKMA